MAKVTLIQVIYNGMRYIPQSFDSMMQQTARDVDYVAVICGNADGGKEYIQQHYPAVRIIDLGENAFFARPHNIVFSNYTSDFFQLVNQDLILEPTYVEEMIKVFEVDPHVGAATGKLLKYDFVNNKKLDIIDTTGVTVWTNGRAADRGQNKKDVGQFDALLDVIAVSGAGPMYRREALEDIKMPKFSKQRWQVQNNRLVPSEGGDTNFSTDHEYYDEDFVAYWEDVDLSLRLQARDWKCVYVPAAIGYHGRTAGSSEKDYADVAAYQKHHNSLSSFVRQMNYKNHVFLTLKNIPFISWKFFAREFFMLIYIILLERGTLGIFPIFARQVPTMFKKRRWIAKHRKTSAWLTMRQRRGIVSLVDEVEGVNQSKTSLSHWTKEFFRLMRLVLGKK